MAKNLEKNSFADASGRQWTFRITAQNALDLKNIAGFDVRDIESQDRIAELLSGDLEILDLMGLVLLKQLQLRNMSATDLFEDMTGDELADACWAFVHGCVFFFPSHMRGPMQAWISQVQTMQSRSASLMTEMMESPEMEREMERAMEQARRDSLLGG